MASDKQKIINNIYIYYDRSGFGSRATTLQDAKKKDTTVTKEGVEEFFLEKMLKRRGNHVVRIVL